MEQENGDKAGPAPFLGAKIEPCKLSEKLVGATTFFIATASILVAVATLGATV